MMVLDDNVFFQEVNLGLFATVMQLSLSSQTVQRNIGSLVNIPKFTPRTKHIAIKYHHFRRFVSDGAIITNSIDTAEQIADIFTKPLGNKSFCFLRHQLMGW